MTTCYYFGNPHELVIENRSSSKIFFYISNQYPDTLLPSSSKYVISIQPNSVYCIDNPTQKTYPGLNRKDKMFIFFFDSDTIERYDWKIIREEYKILERRTSSMQDIINSEWRIVYP